MILSRELQVAREELNRVDANVAENRIPRSTHYILASPGFVPQMVHSQTYYFLGGFKKPSNRKGVKRSSLRVLVVGLYVGAEPRDSATHY